MEIVEYGNLERVLKRAGFELRDEINEKVSEYKNKRDDTNAQANELFSKADSIRKQNNLAGPSIKALRKDIDRLEFTQQTEVLSTTKERELVSKITLLQKQYQVKKVQLEGNLELKVILDEAQQIRDEASEFHNQLAEYARQAQEYHAVSYTHLTLPTKRIV